jgi:membrane protein DedA with SNARE-associated domain
VFECQFDSTSNERLDQVPEEIVLAMKNQRSIEARWVNSFAYLGVLIAVVGGIAFVLATPIFDDRLIYATVAYGLILLIGSRVLAGFLGGYSGDQIGYSKGRAQTIKVWDAYRSKNRISS